jgi:hypothetical protein
LLITEKSQKNAGTIFERSKDGPKGRDKDVSNKCIWQTLSKETTNAHQPKPAYARDFDRNSYPPRTKMTDEHTVIHNGDTGYPSNKSNWLVFESQILLKSIVINLFTKG